ncbi:hypothetical protein [Kineococcus sp. SYSU DK002]|uniref:hypothetical protein n=1 Tax=Kineococcus sp. SYSU DK002 TaxID=3383123 RepID=UPI003D7D2D8E
MSQDQRHEPTVSFLDELFPGGAGDLPLVPRGSARDATTTSAAFGGVDVGPPVSRLSPPDPLPEPAPEPAPGPGPGSAALAARPQRCPSCGARARAEQDWCSLCHTSLLPAPAAPAPVGQRTPAPTDRADEAPGEVPGPAAARVVEGEDGQLALDFGPAATTGARAVLDEDEVERMLGALARSGGAGPRGLGTRRAKVLLAAGGALGLSALLLGAMTVLGAVVG